MPLQQISTNDLSGYITQSQLSPSIIFVPTGGLMMWPTSSAPSGYLMCDGTAVSRTTYSALYAIVGTTFGAGDGTTTFNLPNYTNRIPYGTTIGATGGTADAVVVSHTHAATVTDTGHFHAEFNTDSPGSGPQVTSSNYSTVNSGNGYYAYTILGTSTAPTIGLTSTNTTGVTVSNASAGTSGTNQNLPPYLGINFIIKI